MPILPTPITASEGAAAAVEESLAASAPDATQLPQTQQLPSESQERLLLQNALLPEQDLDKAVEEFRSAAGALTIAEPSMADLVIAGLNKLELSLDAMVAERQGPAHTADSGPLLPRSSDNTLKQQGGLADRNCDSTEKQSRGTENQPATRPLPLIRPEPQGKQLKGPSQKLREGFAKELSQKT